MTGKELWAIFDEECRNNGTEALLFGDSGWPSGRRREPGPPEDLTIWNAIAVRLNRSNIMELVEAMKKSQKKA